ncbi:hypothetical protein LJB81_00540 [Desulfovibrio sp. OttesenSCG-928-M14]|nr:hypothetical protein [Desulfovibrio sp. OttesenSCG-928-M14]
MSLTMTTTEIKTIDSKVEQMLDWASSRQAEAEQLSFDAVRLLSCTSDRLDKTKNQGFFKRCWNRFNGDADAAERANTGDLIQMQKISLRYINMLQEQQLMLAHSMLSLKNNLYSLAVKEEETRHLVALLAKNTLERFEKLEHRVDQLEISTNLQGWLLALEERDYDEKFPTEYMRLFRVINDFYSLKNDEWNYNDLMFMRKAIRTVNINPKRKLSLNVFIDSLTDEIQQESVGFNSYKQAITMFNTQSIDNYSHFAIENISSPVFTSIHGLKVQYMDRLDIVEEFIDQFQITQSEALKRLLRRSIANLGVNLDYQFPLAETAIEVLGCIRLAEKLAVPHPQQTKDQTIEKIQAKNSKKSETSIENAEAKTQPVTQKEIFQKIDVSNLTMSDWKNGSKIEIACEGLNFGSSALKIKHHNNGFYATYYDKIFFSSNLTKWNELDIPAQFAGEDISYENVYYNGKTWFLCGQYEVQYSYTKKGFLKNSTETNSYYSYVIFSGEDFSELKAYSFTQDFPMYEVTGIAHCDNTLVALLRHEEDGDDDACMVISKNGFSWKKFDISNEDVYYRGIISHGNKCFVETSDSMLEFSLKNGKLKNINHKFPGNLENIYSFPEHNAAFYYYPGYGEKRFCVTNDFKEWIDIDLPKVVTEKLLYKEKQLILICNSGETLYRDFY